MELVDLLNSSWTNLYQAYQLIDLKVLPALGIAWGIVVAAKGKLNAETRKKLTQADTK